MALQRTDNFGCWATVCRFQMSFCLFFLFDYLMFILLLLFVFFTSLGMRHVQGISDKFRNYFRFDRFLFCLF